MACRVFTVTGVCQANVLNATVKRSSGSTSAKVRNVPGFAKRPAQLRSSAQLKSALSRAALPNRTSRPSFTCHAAAASAAVTSEAPKVSLTNRIKLAVVTAYLSWFGRFELAIKLLVAAVFPSKIKGIFKGLFASYKQQLTIATGNATEASKKTALVFKDMIQAYAGQILGTPYEFPSYHQAIREPFDYYKMGNDYVGSLIDYDRSVLGNVHLWDQIQAQVDAGENVILLANHQSEADAAFIPLLTQASHPGLGERVTYLAGDRVTGDIMSKPFSMGRNLLCIFSKKHMVNDEKKEKSRKQRANLRTLKEMEGLLKRGGAILWIAPSGGRDRPDETGKLEPDPFDPDAITMMVKFGTKKTVKKTHFYPMAMATFDIMPPPISVGGGLGEQRVVNYTGTGISVAEPIDVTTEGSWAKGVPEEEHKKALTAHIYDSVMKQYRSIVGCVGTGDDFDAPEECSRPWLGIEGDCSK